MKYTKSGSPEQIPWSVINNCERIKCMKCPTPELGGRESPACFFFLHSKKEGDENKSKISKLEIGKWWY